MSEQHTGSDVDTELVRALCAEARSLAGGLRGPVSRLRLKAGDHAVEIEWELDHAGAPAGASTGATQTHTAVAGAPAEQGDGGEDDRHAIVAPLLGTYYAAPEPGAKPFVEEGDMVEAGQDVAIVEAMKIMNRVQADRAGRVAKILAGDGEMVEFGQPLMLLEPHDAGA